MQVEGSGDSSAVAGASILASLSSNIHKDLSLLPPPTKTGENATQNSEVLSVDPGLRDDSVEIEMKDAAKTDDLAEGILPEKGVLPSSDAAKGNPSDSMRVDPGVDADAGKVNGAAYELRPLLRMLAGSSTELDLGSSISKILEERRDLRELLKEFDPPTILASTRRQAFKESLQRGILNPDDIDVSFESFPYFLRCKHIFHVEVLVVDACQMLKFSFNICSFVFCLVAVIQQKMF